MQSAQCYRGLRENLCFSSFEIESQESAEEGGTGDDQHTTHQATADEELPLPRRGEGQRRHRHPGPLEAAEASHVIYTLGFRTETTTDAGPREGGKGKTSIIQKKTLSRGHACTYGGGGESEKLKCTCKWFGDDDFRPCKHHDLPSQFLPQILSLQSSLI